MPGNFFGLKNLEDIIFILILIFEVAIIVTIIIIHCSFNDVVSSTDYLASNVIMMNSEGCEGRVHDCFQGTIPASVSN
jgi:hypothetical protein